MTCRLLDLQSSDMRATRPVVICYASYMTCGHLLCRLYDLRSLHMQATKDGIVLLYDSFNSCTVEDNAVNDIVMLYIFYFE